MAADVLSTQAISVDIYDAMPSFGRKFLMAGKSGLNISHSEDQAAFLTRYTPHTPLADYVSKFGAPDIMDWMSGLGIEAFVGSSGRIFPKQMKASPLLRALLNRLQERGVRFHTRYRWTGWSSNTALTFQTPDGRVEKKSSAMLLALGGASWKRLGSDGAWTELLSGKGVALAPFRPSNCGFSVNWTAYMSDRFAGAPVKSVRLRVKNQPQLQTRSEFVITKTGVESGGIYRLSAALVAALSEARPATLVIDLLPDLSEDAVLTRLQRPRGKASLSKHLNRTLNLSGVKLALLYELTDSTQRADAWRLAQQIKALKLPLVAPAPMDDAISTSGGVRWEALDEQLMLRDLPAVFCAGEMIDWDAPTGGYLITACLATGVAAAEGITDWLSMER